MCHSRTSLKGCKAAGEGRWQPRSLCIRHSVPRYPRRSLWQGRGLFPKEQPAGISRTQRNHQSCAAEVSRDRGSRDDGVRRGRLLRLQGLLPGGGRYNISRCMLLTISTIIMYCTGTKHLMLFLFDYPRYVKCSPDCTAFLYTLCFTRVHTHGTFVSKGILALSLAPGGAAGMGHTHSP